MLFPVSDETDHRRCDGSPSLPERADVSTSFHPLDASADHRPKRSIGTTLATAIGILAMGLVAIAYMLAG